MIKAYLTATPSLYEGEDIEVRYSLFQNDIHIKKKVVCLEYQKPAIVGLVSVLTLLKALEEYKEQEITVIINDASLYEVVKDTSTTKNRDILLMAGKTKKQLGAFDHLCFINVTKQKEALAEWKEILEA